MAGDCFLIGLAPVLVHMSKGPDGRFPFHPVSINLLVEVAKTVFATIILMIYVSPHPCPQSAFAYSYQSVKLSSNETPPLHPLWHGRHMLGTWSKSRFQTQRAKQGVGLDLGDRGICT